MYKSFFSFYAVYTPDNTPFSLYIFWRDFVGFSKCLTQSWTYCCVSSRSHVLLTVSDGHQGKSLIHSSLWILYFALSSCMIVTFRHHPVAYLISCHQGLTTAWELYIKKLNAEQVKTVKKNVKIPILKIDYEKLTKLQRKARYSNKKELFFFSSYGSSILGFQRR